MATLLIAQGSLLLSISAICSIVFLLLVPWSLTSLYRLPVKVRLSWQGRWKLVRIPLGALNTNDTDSF